VELLLDVLQPRVEFLDEGVVLALDGLDVLLEVGLLQLDPVADPLEDRLQLLRGLGFERRDEGPVLGAAGFGTEDVADGFRQVLLRVGGQRRVVDLPRVRLGTGGIPVQQGGEALGTAVRMALRIV
jgi:hypothetical protein